MPRKKSNIYTLLTNFDQDMGTIYTEGEILAAIENLPDSLKEKVKAVYGDTYHDVILDVDEKIAKSVATSIIPRLKKTIRENHLSNIVPASPEPKDVETNKHTITKRRKYYTDTSVMPADIKTSLDPIEVIKEVIKTQTLSEVEDFLTPEEGILLVLRLGTSRLGTYSPSLLAKMFNMSLDDVNTTLQLAIERYTAYLDSLVTKDYQKVNK